MKTSIKKSKLEPGKDATFEFSSKPKSIIGLLAFDKSLTFLRTGNDIDKNNVVSTVDGNPENPMNILKSDLKSWKICTQDEKDIINKAKTVELDIRFGDEDSEEFDDGFENEIESDEEPPARAGEVRKNFPETWIFETFEMPSESEILEKKFKLPDTITTWTVSSFSINPRYGFALEDPHEILATQEFFLKMSLPYAIKFGEILKIDIVIFNYIKSESNVNVKLKLYDDDFNIVELKDPETCEIFDLSSNQDKAGEISFELPSNSGTTKSFYIRPSEQKKNLKIKVKAIATETKNKRKRYADNVEKNLRVIHEGATHYKGEMKTFDFSSKTTNTTSGKLEFENAVESSILIHGSITGNIIGPSLSVYEEFL